MRSIGGKRWLVLALCCLWALYSETFTPGQLRQLPRWGRVRARAAAGSSRAGAEKEVAEERFPLQALNIGQMVEGRVTYMNVRGASLAYVDIGAEKDAVLEYGEMEDGFPSKLTPVRKGSKVETRVLEYDEDLDRLYLTRRSGSLSRPARLAKAEENHDPEPLRRVAESEFLDAEVVGIHTFGVFVNVFPSWGERQPVFALLHKKEFAGGFAQDPEKAIRGGKIKVRKLATNQRGELKVTMKLPV
ncbi:unnamed protein product [Effrenium voratum]|nr:unnamed protein product [Effrenium voratum]